MKKLFLLLVVSGSALFTYAQSPSGKSGYGHKRWFAADSLLSRTVVDINLLGGAFTQDITAANTMGNYPNAIADVSRMGKLSFSDGWSYGFDAQVGFFFGKKRHFGIGTGFMYLRQQGELELDQFHVEYQATDFAGNTYRQLITANHKIEEKIEINNINIPLLLKYKYRFSKKLGFTADLGALFNVYMSNEYKSNASFDYEAIYKLNGSGSDVSTSYDNSPTPASTDVFYTRAEYVRVNPGQNVDNYFNNTLRNAGYNVGLCLTSSEKKLLMDPN